LTALATVPAALLARQANAELAAAKALALPADAIATTPEEHATLAAIVTGLHDEHKALDEERKALKAEHLARAAAVDAPRMPVIRKLAEAKEHLKTIQAKSLAAVVITREVNEARAVAADAAGDSAGLVQASALNGELQAVDTSGLKLVWTPAEIDAAKLPAQYLLPDVKSLDALGRATPSNLAPPDVSGVTWKLTPRINAKGSKK
jgi:hypothetical protein